ncbi:hypothetical protein AWC26_09380 [Mycobacterium shimoidei]|nr:hypothetical protein BHQ16_04480 [Mycobacterium shimoidei]ORW81060.1 hypothetical protein AWC26_09380 [Mycobacterium shimoidei]
MAITVGAALGAGFIGLATCGVADADTGDDNAGVGAAVMSDALISGPDLSPLTLAVDDPDFVSSVRDLGLFTLVSAGDPDDNFVAVVFSTPLFIDVLTSGDDPENNLADFGVPGDIGIGMAGETINTFQSEMFPFLNSTFSIPFEDPLADLFILLIQFGLV